MSASRFSITPELRRELMAAFAGYCGMLVSMGLARFAFTPLIPALIAESWFVSAETFLIGVGIVIGYFIGAIFVTRNAGTAHAVAWVRAAMLVVTLAFFLCAKPMPFVWFLGWMALAGAASGVGLILSAQIVLARVAKARHGLIGGIVIAGIGSGLILSGIVVSLLAERSLTQTWYGFAGLSAILTLVSWRLWPTAKPVALDTVALNTGAVKSESLPAATQDSQDSLRRTPEPYQLPLSVYATYLSYGLGSAAIAFPQLLFPDFMVRGKGFSLSDAGDLWLFTGIGAVLGALLVGALGDRFGMARCYRFCLLLFGLTLLTLTLPLGLASLMALSLLLGVFNFGQVADGGGAATADFCGQRSCGTAGLGYCLAHLCSRTGGRYVVLCPAFGSHPEL